MALYTQKTLAAGKPGTKKWIKEYGKKLLYVRYKYDIENHRKLKTVELIVEDEPWDVNKNRIPVNKIIGVRVLYEEKEIQKVIRSLGGKWNREKKYWEMLYSDAVNLGLEGRIINIIKNG